MKPNNVIDKNELLAYWKKSLTKIPIKAWMDSSEGSLSSIKFNEFTMIWEIVKGAGHTE